MYLSVTRRYDDTRYSGRSPGLDQRLFPFPVSQWDDEDKLPFTVTASLQIHTAFPFHRTKQAKPALRHLIPLCLISDDFIIFPQDVQSRAGRSLRISLYLSHISS